MQATRRESRLLAKKSLLAIAVVLPIWLAAQSPAAAQEPLPADPQIAALEERVEQFFGDVSLGQIDEAHGALLSGGPLAKQTEAVARLAAKTRDIEKKYGKRQGFERIDVKRIGGDLVLVKYLDKCETYPVVWYFTFYRDFKRNPSLPDANGWVAIAVRFDTELELLGL